MISLSRWLPFIFRLWFSLLSGFVCLYDGNLYRLFHAHELRTMAFCGEVKPERWNRLLLPADEMTHFSLNKALGEGVFNYQYTLRTNSDIIEAFIGCLARAEINADNIIRLCRNLFVPAWRKGLEQAVHSLDNRLRIPLPERYMSLPIGNPDLAMAPCRHSLIIRENLTFVQEWPQMKASLNFLLRWRGIIQENNTIWLSEYLRLNNAYIQTGVTFENLNAVDFSTPNAERTSRRKTTFVFPPNYQVENYNDITNVIIVS